MSDERIFAEVVRADRIKVGEKYVILTTGKVPLCSLDDAVPLYTRGSQDEPGCIPGQIVARILPPPVEVRDLWRVKYMNLEGHPDEDYELLKDAIGAMEGVKAKIIPLRAVIMRREEGES